MPRSMIRLLVFALLVPFCASAQDAPPDETPPWKHESEASVVQVSGNASSRSESAKQTTSYTVGKDTATLKGRYLRLRNQGDETARAWDASLRYERAFTEKWSTFIQQGAESDAYAGYIQRDNSDIGGKYFFDKNDITKFFIEAGLRWTRVNPTGAAEPTSGSAGRLYSEYERKANAQVTFKFWVEHLPDFSGNGNDLTNHEPSMTVMLSQIFSLKVSYLTKHQAKPAAPGAVKDDTTFTTSLVAKF